MTWMECQRMNRRSKDMRSGIEKLMKEFISAKAESFKFSAFDVFVREELPEEFRNTGLIDEHTYMVEGNTGTENGAMVPRVCVFHRSLTAGQRKGTCVAYLLSQDGQRLYLCFLQDYEDIRTTHSLERTVQILHERAEDIRSHIQGRGFVPSCGFDLGEGLSEQDVCSREGTVFYTCYEISALPEEDVLRNDLQRMMEVYQAYADWQLQQSRLGTFDSWEVLDAKTAVKHCDKSFFDHNGSGVPQNIQWFFGADSVEAGKTKSLELIFHGERYPSTIRKEPRHGGRARIFWTANLGNKLQAYRHQKDATATFIRLDHETFEMRMIEDDTTMTGQEIVRQIRTFISAKGFSYPDKLVENLYLSLKSKPFVILAGTSGTGKTRLVRLFSEAIGADKENGRYLQIAVRPDWSDSTDLFGHLDLNGRFVPGCLMDFLAKARDDLAHPYVLCLDEMNLARVEYYLSDFLSVIETRDRKEGHIISDPLVQLDQYGADETARERYGEILFPENFYVVGTVNMDETTFPFSKKVLDRANTIEFNDVDLIPDFVQYGQGVPVSVGNAFLKSDYLILKDCKEEDHEYVQQLCTILQSINRILYKSNSHVGFRVRDEICFYMLNNHRGGFLEEKEALDYEIMQKILPRLQGSNLSLKETLCELFRKILAKDYDRQDGDAAGMKELLENGTGIDYPRSAEKVMFMVRRFEEDGFTSYWL